GAGVALDVRVGRPGHGVRAVAENGAFGALRVRVGGAGPDPARLADHAPGPAAPFLLVLAVSPGPGHLLVGRARFLLANVERGPVAAAAQLARRAGAGPGGSAIPVLPAGLLAPAD